MLTRTAMLAAACLLLTACDPDRSMYRGPRPPYSYGCPDMGGDGGDADASPADMWDGVVRSASDCPGRAGFTGHGSGCPCCNAVVGGTGPHACDIPDDQAIACKKCEAARDGLDGGDETACTGLN